MTWQEEVEAARLAAEEESHKIRVIVDENVPVDSVYLLDTNAIISGMPEEVEPDDYDTHLSLASAFDRAIRQEYGTAMRNLIEHSNSLLGHWTGGNVPSARWTEPARRPGRIKRRWLAARERLAETWGVLRHGLPDYDGWDD